jgi:CAAX prenyl protease-like protein
MPEKEVAGRPEENQKERRFRADWAYVLPMGLFLVFTAISGEWPAAYPVVYVLKTVVVALVMIFLWRNYTPIRWSNGWLGVAVGIVGVVQWVGMEKLLPGYPKPASTPFIPDERIQSEALRWGFIAVRWAGASLLVPVMEELFWRDYVWRTIRAPHDFLKEGIGEWDWKTYLVVAVVFGTGVHVDWLTAIVWGLLIGWLLIYTRSVGACIIAHGVTNFLLGLYVLIWKDWRFW